MDYVDPSNVILRKGGAGSDQHYVRFVNPPMHPGAMHAPMPRYYALRDQRRIEHVPRPPHLSPPYESIPAITFSVNGFPGVRVKDVLKDTVTIDGANDAVFAQHGWRSIVVNLEWPGYDSRNFSNAMNSRVNVHPGGRDMTRQNLAREICVLLFNLHKAISKYPISVDFERWALTAGPEGIRVPDIVLFSLHYYRNIWVPELYVIE